MTEEANKPNHPDGDEHKGAVESDRPHSPTDESMAGQLGHRGADPEVAGNDTDYPEPDATAEHSGQHR